MKQLPEWIESERIEGQRRRAVERKERDKANERAQRAPVLQKGTPAESPASGINVDVRNAFAYLLGRVLVEGM